MRKLMIVVAALLVGVIVFVLFVLGGYAISGDVELGTEAHLAAPPEAVFAVLNTYEGQVTWWTEAAKAYEGQGMPEMDIVHAGGPALGTGMQINFLAEGDVSEEWEVLESEASSRITYEVDFQMFVIERTLVLEAEDTGTHVTWNDTGHFDNPVMRYMTLMPTDEVIGNFDRALIALDAVTAP